MAVSVLDQGSGSPPELSTLAWFHGRDPACSRSTQSNHPAGHTTGTANKNIAVQNGFEMRSAPLTELRWTGIDNVPLPSIGPTVCALQVCWNHIPTRQLLMRCTSQPPLFSLVHPKLHLYIWALLMSVSSFSPTLTCFPLTHTCTTVQHSWKRALS